MGSVTGRLLSTLALCVALFVADHGKVRASPAGDSAPADLREHSGAASEPSEASQRDRYRLRARLQPEQRRVEGSVTIVWHNRSRAPLSQLSFHLYANAFADPRSVFMREAGPSLRGTELSRRGGIDLLELRSTDGTDLLVGAQRALVPDDFTQLLVALPHPLAPGAAVTLECRFVVRLPAIVARMGAERDFFMLAQWFPKLAKLEPDGSWANFPYHGLGEFYADFADYELEVDVPEDYVVAAPGERTTPSARTQGRRIESYRLHSAIDVAWAASPDLVRLHEPDVRSGSTQVEVFAPRGHLGAAREQARQLRRWLPQLGARLGAYPHSRLVLVLPPSYAIGAAGMEYPGLIVGWVVDWTDTLNPWADELLSAVSAHELAHQWFALLLASHEAQTPVLDEGLAQWVGMQLLQPRLGREYFSRILGVPLDLFELTRLGLPARTPSSLLPAAAYRPDELGSAIYVRPALALESIARTWGRERLWSTLGQYARAHRFGHPRLHALWSAFDSGYWPGFTDAVLRPALEGESFATRLAPSGAAKRVERAAARTLPERVEVARRGGPSTWLRWPGRGADLPLPSPRRRAGVSVDPDRHNLLDPDRRDDQVRDEADAPAPALAQRLELLAQALLLVLGL